MPSQTLRALLEADVCKHIKNAYADNTRRAYNSHRRSYLAFCKVMGVAPVPASAHTICQYAAILAKSLKFSSIKQYLNIVRILHFEWDLPDPMANNYNLSCVLRGIRRDIGDAPCRKRPITPHLLEQLLSQLDLSRLEDRAMWAAMLLLFYGLLRVASVLCRDLACNHACHVTRPDLRLHSGGIDVTIRTTKTIQFRQRRLVVPLPRVPGALLCPTQALACYLATPGLPTHGHSPSPAFWVRGNPSPKPLTAPHFNSRLRRMLTSLGYESGQVSGHSFRRGGACHLYAMDVPVDTIRIIGDWKSNSYTDYILAERPLVAEALHRMVNGTKHMPK